MRTLHLKFWVVNRESADRAPEAEPGGLAGMRLHNDSQLSSALSSRVLKALEHCLGGRENRNHFRIPIEHSNGEGAIDDAKYRRGRRPFVDREGL